MRLKYVVIAFSWTELLRATSVERLKEPCLLQRRAWRSVVQYRAPIVEQIPPIISRHLARWQDASTRGRVCSNWRVLTASLKNMGLHRIRCVRQTSTRDIGQDYFSDAVKWTLHNANPVLIH
ncbi:hypothetical protein EDB80DRAFT_175332 [Ilyonectria destructans]|nr:hypothetical protein EDB80DRAFT_175332 [Ilyonectria destructans]